MGLRCRMGGWIYIIQRDVTNSSLVRAWGTDERWAPALLREAGVETDASLSSSRVGRAGYVALCGACCAAMHGPVRGTLLGNDDGYAVPQ